MRKKRPVVITLVAFFQFFKAGYFALLFWKIWDSHRFWAAQGKPTDDPLVNQLVKDPIFLLFPAISIALIIFGLGLWNLENWARKNLAFLILLCWCNGGLSLNGYLFGKDGLMSRWDLPTLACVFLLDLFVFCCLVFYPDVGRIFGEREG
jgi:hypothetical protein